MWFKESPREPQLNRVSRAYLVVHILLAFFHFHCFGYAPCATWIIRIDHHLLYLTTTNAPLLVSLSAASSPHIADCILIYFSAMNVWMGLSLRSGARRPKYRRNALHVRCTRATCSPISLFKVPSSLERSLVKIGMTATGLPQATTGSCPVPKLFK